jgi:hypothetical protein
MAQRSTAGGRVVRLVNAVVAAIATGRHDAVAQHSSTLVPTDITNEVVLHLAGRVPGMMGRGEIPTAQVITFDVVLRYAHQVHVSSHSS